MSYAFARYEALGNDMIVLDPATFSPDPTPDLVRRLCHRHFGLGADGICYGPLPENRSMNVWSMRFFNPDGSEAEKSGNGLCIFGRYLRDRGLVSEEPFTVQIQGEGVDMQLTDRTGRRVKANLGQLTFDSAHIPVQGPRRQVVEESVMVAGRPFTITAAAIGNPHCIIFADGASATTVQDIGPLLERAPLFPQRTNVQLARVLDRQTLQIAIWERGAGYTLASGTSACAAAAAAVRTGRCSSPITVHMAGGAALVSVAADWAVTLTTTVRAVCQGELAGDLVSTLQQLAD